LLERTSPKSKPGSGISGRRKVVMCSGLSAPFRDLHRTGTPAWARARPGPRFDAPASATRSATRHDEAGAVVYLPEYLRGAGAWSRPPC
jgi:hypothetical protein